VFLGLVPFITIGAMLTLPSLRQLAGGSQAPRDWSTIIAALRLSSGAALALAGLGQASLPIAAALIAAGAVIGWPALRRLLPQGTLRAAPGLPAAIATQLLLNLAFFGVDAFVPLALTSVRGQTATVAGLALTAATIGWTTGAWVQAHLAPRQGRRHLVMAGLGLIALGIAGVACTLWPSAPVLLAPAAWGVSGLGMGLAFSTISLVVLDAAPPGHEGTASSALQLANVLGFALGAGLGGVIIGNTGARAVVSQSSILVQDIAMLAIIALAVLTAGRLPDRPHERQPE
jgi:MFS family permease